MAHQLDCSADRSVQRWESRDGKADWRIKLSNDKRQHLIHSVERDPRVLHESQKYCNLAQRTEEVLQDDIRTDKRRNREWAIHKYASESKPGDWINDQSDPDARGLSRYDLLGSSYKLVAQHKKGPDWDSLRVFTCSGGWSGYRVTISSPNHVPARLKRSPKVSLLHLYGRLQGHR